MAPPEAPKDDELKPAFGGDPAGSAEAGEDVGGFSSLEAALSLLRVVRPAEVARASAKLGVEIAKIAAGQSEIKPAPKDWRFQDRAWSENPVYRRIAQVYLAWSQAVTGLVDDKAPNWRNVERAKFALEVLTTAAAPTNLLVGNPAALKEVLDTGGLNLVRGARNMLGDLWRNGGMPSQIDRSDFEVGKDLAVTPGAVVLRNEFLELLQYQPTTESVHAQPTLMIPPQINKYYFMDLAPGRSFIEYAVGRGVPFFTISWRNPTAAQADWDLDAYIQAVFESIDAVREITGSDQLNTLSLCAGGMLTAAMLSYMAANGDDRVAAAAFGVTLLDWEQRAPMGLFANAGVVSLARWFSRRRGILPGDDLARIFAWARPNDLVWNYWVNNYLLGKKPPAFDILAWNVDSTNLPAALHAQYMEIFSENALCEPGAVKVLGKPIDLRAVEIDTFVTGAVADHLTPWRGCYRTTQLLSGDSTFVLSNAGHIASLINPPGNPKANYFLGPPPGHDPDAWLEQAKQHKGTWWEVWADWIEERAGDSVPAPRELGSGRHPAREPAPGRYVFQQA